VAGHMVVWWYITFGPHNTIWTNQKNSTTLHKPWSKLVWPILQKLYIIQKPSEIYEAFRSPQSQWLWVTYNCGPHISHPKSWQSQLGKVTDRQSKQWTDNSVALKRHLTEKASTTFSSRISKNSWSVLTKCTRSAMYSSYKWSMPTTEEEIQDSTRSPYHSFA
jgi:hypothetical protein